MLQNRMGHFRVCLDFHFLLAISRWRIVYFICFSSEKKRNPGKSGNAINGRLPYMLFYGIILLNAVIGNQLLVALFLPPSHFAPLQLMEECST